MVHSKNKKSSKAYQLKRGIYQVYKVNPKRRQRSLPIYFDLSLLIAFIIGLLLYLSTQ